LSLKYSTPDVVATQLWLTPLFGTLCGTSAMAMAEDANSNAVAIVAVVDVLVPLFLVIVPPRRFRGPASTAYMPVATVASFPTESMKSRRSEETMLTVIARYVVSGGHESTVARLLRKNAEASRAEPGCLEFSVYQEIDDPRAILLFERYTGEDAFQAHRRMPHFRDIIEKQVVPLLDERAWTRIEPLPN
jgi:quinol monooxygenase YgiN